MFRVHVKVRRQNVIQTSPNLCDTTSMPDEAKYTFWQQTIKGGWLKEKKAYFQKRMYGMVEDL